MRKWMRDRLKRRTKGAKEGSDSKDQKKSGPAPLQPTFLDRDSDWSGVELNGVSGEHAAEQAREAQRRIAREHEEDKAKQPVYESQPEADPQDHPRQTEAEGEGGAEAQAEGQRGEGRGARTRRRGRGGRGRGRTRERRPEQQNPPVVIQPGVATGEAGEVDMAPAADAGTDPEPQKATKAQGKKQKAPKGAVVLAIGLPGSGKSSWFRRHNIIPLSSDLVRGLLLDDATEQRYQDLVFSTLRYMLRMRMVAGRPTNYIDATNLSPKERHSWIKMARDFNYEAHAVFFDVPTETCMERNRKRSRNVPDDIMTRMAQKLRPPKFEEGFSKITIVRLKKAEPGSRQDHEGGLDPED